MKKGLGLLLLLLVLTGCKDTTKTATTCKSTIKQENSVELQQEEKMDATGDEITKHTATSKMDFNAMPGDVVMNDQEILEYVQEDTSIKRLLELNEIDGVKSTVTVEKGIIVRAITIDYQKADTKKLEEAGIIDGDQAADYISLEKTVDYLTTEQKSKCDTKEID